MVCGVCNVWGNVDEKKIAHKEKGSVYEKRTLGMGRNKMEERRGEAIISERKRN